MRILSLLITGGLILVILGVALGIGADVVRNVQDNYCQGDPWDIEDTCSNATGGSAIAMSAAANSSLALGTLAEWQGTVGTVIAATVIIGLLMAGFGAFLYSKGGSV